MAAPPSGQKTLQSAGLAPATVRAGRNGEAALSLRGPCPRAAPVARGPAAGWLDITLMGGLTERRHAAE